MQKVIKEYNLYTIYEYEDYHAENMSINEYMFDERGDIESI